MPATSPPTLRVLMFAPAGASLLAGLWAGGLLVVGAGDGSGAGIENVHGILMVLGFLGTLIALERAVALRSGWGFAGPAALGLGGIALLTPAPRGIAQTLLIVGCGFAVAVLAALSGRQGDESTATQVLAATLALGAAILWVRVDVATLLPWLVGYVVLTVVAERVELARLALPKHAGVILLALATAVHASVVASTLWPAVGHRLLGGSLLVLVAWIARADVARRTIRSTGLPRYSAAAMLIGYAWLAAAGVTWLVTGMPETTAAYDTVVHACFLGFGMSMVMAHAPVILPAVLRVALPYRPVMWVPLGLLHVGLLVRLALGNWAGYSLAWQVGSFVGIASLLGFAATAAWCALTVRRSAGTRPPGRAATPGPAATGASAHSGVPS